MLVTLNEVLKKAQQQKYAVGLFNTVNMEMLEAAIGAAEQQKSPIIIGTAEILLPYGELKRIGPSIIDMAKRATVPVVVHFDHGLTFDRCIEAMKLGFSSIMYDCSTLSESENIETTREMAKIAHSFGCSIEGEIGHVGGTEDTVAETADSSQYTEVESAVKFAKATSVDALAVAVGTAHGSYKTKPILDFDRIGAISRAIRTPLVLHGGSGLSDADFMRTIAGGIAKINVFTDLCLAGERAIKMGLQANKDYLSMLNMQVSEINQEITKKMLVFGSINKA